MGCEAVLQLSATSNEKQVNKLLSVDIWGIKFVWEAGIAQMLNSLSS